MNSYEFLANSYDGLTIDVSYEKRADFLERFFQKSKLPIHTVLDLACGTGTMTWILADRGYEMIGVDQSGEMLCQAQGKGSGREGIMPLFLQQSMPKLDLYGTVDAAVCLLDSVNYLTRPEDVVKTLQRLHLFIAPGGLLIFDINTRKKLNSLNGQVFLDENETSFCTWRCEMRKDIISYYMDIFRETDNGLWERGFEEHKERAYDIATLKEYLAQTGFVDVRVYGDLTMRHGSEEDLRVYFVARRSEK